MSDKEGLEAIPNIPLRPSNPHDPTLFTNSMAATMHSHDGITPHSHNGPEHGHSHEILDGPGSYLGREMPLSEARDWHDRAFTIGIGG